jgi:C2 domain
MATSCASSPPVVGEAAELSPEDSKKKSAVAVDTEIKWLCEIVGGYHLVNEDAPSETEVDEVGMKPFCIVRFGDQVIHKSLPAEGGRNPIWTVSTGAFFLLKSTPAALVHQPLAVSVWSKKMDPLLLETAYFLGKAVVDLSEVLTTHGNEERYEIELQDGECITGMDRGKLTLRFRLAIPLDERFLSLLNTNPEMLKQRSTRLLQADGEEISETTESLLVTEANETKVAGDSFLNVLSSAFTSKRKIDKTSGNEMVLVKPFPDPTNVKQTTYLSTPEFHNRIMEPSHEWVEAGSGQLGKVFLEVLCCKDLPNVDVGEVVGNVTDSFVSAVFEDAMVQTPVIDDELSPHWLPWTQRAFIFKMMHPASTLYLAAFDYDIGITKHEPLGRVAINISNFQPDTEYTLTYKLYPSANVTDRSAIGSVTVRLRIEYNDERESLLAALRPRPTFHINVRKEKSLSVLRYTCFGEYGDDNEHPFDLTVTRSYVNEIFEYKRNIGYCMSDAIRSLIFWRPQVRVVNLYLPLHSFFFFCFATTFVERPYLAPSFFLLSIAWIMIASHTLRMQHPSPWNRCHSLWHYASILRTGKSPRLVRSIKVNQGSIEAEKYEMEIQDRVEKDLSQAAKQYEMQQEIASLGDESIHTKLPMGIPLDMFVRLTRYQGIIGRMCKKMRLIKSVITWEEGVVSFWITFCFLAAGLVSLLFPWLFILRWGSRLVVWGLFGPHMMILDWWLRAEGKDEAALKKAMENFKKDSWFARLRRQEALKLRDMKCLAFGKFITLIPSFNLSRHYDRPLPESFARLHSPSVVKGKVSRRGVPGQQLFGIVLPRSEFESLKYKDQLDSLPDLHSEICSCIKEIKDSEKGTLFQRILAQLGQDNDDSDEVGYELVSCKNDNECESSDENLNESQHVGTKVDSCGGFSNVAILLQDPIPRKRMERFSASRIDKSDSQYPLIRTISMQVGESSEIIADSLKLEKDKELTRTQSWSAGDNESTIRASARQKFPSLMEIDEDRECGDVEVFLSLPPIREESTFEENNCNGYVETRHEQIELLSWTHAEKIECDVVAIPANDSVSVTETDQKDPLGSLFESDTDASDEAIPSISSCRSDLEKSYETSRCADAITSIKSLTTM